MLVNYPNHVVKPGRSIVLPGLQDSTVHFLILFCFKVHTCCIRALLVVSTFYAFTTREALVADLHSHLTIGSCLHSPRARPRWPCTVWATSGMSGWAECSKRQAAWSGGGAGGCTTRMRGSGVHILGLLLYSILGMCFLLAWLLPINSKCTVSFTLGMLHDLQMDLKLANILVAVGMEKVLLS